LALIDRPDDLVAGRIDDAQRMVPFDGGEETPAVRRHCRAVRVFPRPHLADDLETAQVDDVNVVAGAIGHIKFLHRFLLVGARGGRQHQGQPQDAQAREAFAHDHSSFLIARQRPRPAPR
jgi:hypothetical protein